MGSVTALTADRPKLYNIAFVLAIVTVSYNIIEGLISMWLGYADESLALFGFGTDSFVEVISGLGIAHMVIRVKNNPRSKRNVFENRALRITGVSFYILTAGLVISGIYNLVTKHRPEATLWGVVISAVSILTMVLLITGKLRTGRKLQSDAILADAECTRVCVYMSVILLISSAIYELTGFIYIDSLGALGLAWFSFSEGRECFNKVKTGAGCIDGQEGRSD
jgi:divalent metal cation (Fe/Co/Zn/Cd) transporter